MKEKILIADDDPVMIKLLEYNLKKNDYDVASCTEGLGVMEKAKEGKPVLAILDYILPGKTGLDLIEDFRSDEEFKDLPIIVITQRGEDEIREKLLAAGAQRIYTKPYSHLELIGVIRELIQKQPNESKK